MSIDHIRWREAMAVRDSSIYGDSRNLRGSEKKLDEWATEMVGKHGKAIDKYVRRMASFEVSVRRVKLYGRRLPSGAYMVVGGNIEMYYVEQADSWYVSATSWGTSKLQAHIRRALSTGTTTTVFRPAAKLQKIAEYGAAFLAAERLGVEL